jgi:hypothetical protein
MTDPTNTYEYRRDVQAETHEQDEEFINSVVTEQDRRNATEWLADADNAYDIWRDDFIF